MRTLSTRRVPARGLAAAALVLLLTPSVPTASSAADTDQGAQLSVTVPDLPYEARADELWAGPYPSRLDVLANDVGPVGRDSLAVVDDGGRLRVELAVGRLGRIRVEDGVVRLDPRPHAHGTATFRYRAWSATGTHSNEALATVRLFDPVLTLGDDTAATSAGTPVVVDVAANDRLLVAGAERPCAPRLFAHPPPTVHPVPLVLPEPARTPYSCTDPAPLTTRDGTWTVQADGRVAFAPAKGFRGAARISYRQTSQHPFDLAEATVTVQVGRGGTAVLGVVHGPRAGTGGGGPLPRTGAGVGVALLAGLVLLLLGWRARRTAVMP